MQQIPYLAVFYYPSSQSAPMLYIYLTILDYHVKGAFNFFGYKTGKKGIKCLKWQVARVAPGLWSRCAQSICKLEFFVNLWGRESCFIISLLRIQAALKSFRRKQSNPNHSQLSGPHGSRRNYPHSGAWPLRFLTSIIPKRKYDCPKREPIRF